VEEVYLLQTRDPAPTRSALPVKDHGQLAAGAPGAYEVMFPGLAHDDAVVDEVVRAAAEAALATTS
jgi:hypothetical protein